MENSKRTPLSISTQNDYKDWIVLIVDDQPDNLAVAKAVLAFQGAQVYGATNGEEGLETLHTIHPTFVLLDLSMPKMDGWEMLRRIRAQPDLHDLPIIALTAHAMDGDEARVLNAGFNGYIAKPFDVTTLASQIQRIIGLPKPHSHEQTNKLGA